MPVCSYKGIDGCMKKLYDRAMTLKHFRPDGVSLGAVARKMGKARSTVQHIESIQNPNILTIKAYAEAVGVSPLEVAVGLLTSYEKNRQSAC
jgi:transcriptional regulator with XRE-family HTH domain